MAKGNKFQVRHPNTLLNWRTEKVRDIDDWAKHPKPYNEYKEKALLSSSEKHFLYHSAKRLGGGNYANLGTWGGVSAACMAYGLRDAGQTGTIYAVDIFSIPKVRHMPEKIPQNFRDLGLDKHVDLTICKGWTAEWAEKLKDVKFKFIFVDADHSYEACKEDFDLWSPMLEVGGEIAFHDCEYESVDNVMNENLKEPEWKFVRQIWRIKQYKRVK